jgi:hypothetical protein
MEKRMTLMTTLKTRYSSLALAGEYPGGGDGVLDVDGMIAGTRIVIRMEVEVQIEEGLVDMDVGMSIRRTTKRTRNKNNLLPSLPSLPRHPLLPSPHLPPNPPITSSRSLNPSISRSRLRLKPYEQRGSR